MVKLNKVSPFIIILLLFFLCAFYVFFTTGHKNLLPDINELIKLTLAHSYYYDYTDDHMARNKDFYAPLYFHSSALLCKSLFNKFTYQKSVFVNVFYFLITIIAIYLTILKLCRKRYIAICGMLLFSSLPGTVYFTSRYAMEVSLMASVALCLCAFVYSEYFKNRLASFALGISLALGMLCKITFPFYAFLPLAAGVYIALIHKDRTKRLVNLSITLTVFLIGFLWWYISFFNIDKLIFSFHDSLQERAGITQGYLTFLAINFQRICFLFKELLSIGVMLLLFVISLIHLKKKMIRGRMVWLWFLSPVLGYAFFKDCAPRYLLPILPVVAIIIAIEAWSLGKKSARWILIFALTFAFIGSISGISFQQENKRANPAEGFLTYILEDAQRKNISNPLLGLDAFHDPENMIQDLYFSFWFLRLHNRYPFSIFYRDIETLQALTKGQVDFTQYYEDFLKCDYIIDAQGWDGWLKIFPLLAVDKLLMKDDMDMATFIGRYYLFRSFQSKKKSVLLEQK